MNPADCQPKLQQQYERATWQALLPQLLPGVEMFAQPHDFPLTSEYERGIATARRQFGAATLADGKRIAFYEIEVAPDIQIQSNRVGLRSLIIKCIDEVSAHAVLAFFVQPGKSFYRLTYAAKESRLGDDMKVRTEQTAPRRFTYILGEGESCRTAAERFGKLPRNTKIADLTEAFSVDKLNKEFFADFRKAFDVVAKDILARNKGWEQPDAERETQTLLNRLLFLYFIQRKGWLDRQPKYLLTHFNRIFQDDPEGTSFNDKFLKPFFVKLSAEDVYFPNLELGDLPFLNGGLFDDEIGSLTERGRMKVGNAAFRHVFDRLLEAYNFTVREDTPLDQEVAIDPEMIGKIFESLVLQLEQSDTGGNTSRHDTGSYYTPRPIVHYLCREGLRAWLEQFPPSKAKAAEWPVRLEKLFTLDASDGIDDDERNQLNELLTPDEARTMLDRLDDFRACDPAVGSGAFLVGLLHELVNLRRLCESRARGKDPAADIEWLYETKKRVIENVLYGVDIQQRAVEICKLRLWISLMVDYPLEVDPHNCALPDFRRALKRITPLPNLDFKIRRANSLIEYIRGQAVKFPQAASDSRDFALSLSKLATAKHRFYEARKKKDKRLAQLDALEATAELSKFEFSATKLKYGLLPEEKDFEQIEKLSHAEAEMGKLQVQIAAARKKGERDKDDEIERLSLLFNDEIKPTFVWQLDFAEIFHRQDSGIHRRGSLLHDTNDKSINPTAENSGFDLVLANPPFVRMELFKDIKPELRNYYPYVHAERADLYCYFYARGVELLSKGGVISFISSNKFFRVAYGEPLRTFLAKNLELHCLVDFGDLPIFEATAYPCIVVGRNVKPSDAREVMTFNVKTTEDLESFPNLPPQLTKQKLFGKENWRIESAASAGFLSRIVQAGTSLRDYVDAKVVRGITTGLNDAFVIDRSTRDRLIAEHKPSAELLKPYVRGKDIKRWRIDSSDLFIIVFPCGFHEELKKYPAILRHLQRFESQLKQRGQCTTSRNGKTVGQHHWLELDNNPKPSYLESFESPKIVSTKVSIRPTFAFDTSGNYLANTSYFFPATSDAHYLLGLLNSNVFQAYAKKVFVEKQNDWYEIQPKGLEAFPIPPATQKQKGQLAVLVSYAIYLAKTFSQEAEHSNEARDELMKSYFQQLIDAMVYELFFQDELHQAGKYFFEHLAEEGLPALDAIKGDKTAKLRTIFERLFDKDHVIRKNCFFLDTLETVRIIEGKA